MVYLGNVENTLERKENKCIGSKVIESFVTDKI